MFEGCCFFIFFIEFENIDPQDAMYSRGKTSSCLTSPFLKTFKDSMISCPFWHNFAVMFQAILWQSFRWFLDGILVAFHEFVFKNGTPVLFLLGSFFYTLSTLFRKGVFEGSLAHFEYLFGQFWHRKQSFSAPESVKPLKTKALCGMLP